MFICMEKINFISSFIFEILQKLVKRHCKLTVLGTWEMLDHPYQNHSINLQQIFVFISMQKITFITYFFIKVLQRNSKPFILDNLAMSGHIHLKRQYHFAETFDVYQWAKKSTSSFMLSLGYCTLVVLNTLGMPSYATPVYLQVKIQLHSPCSSADIARYANLCKLLQGYLVAHTEH